MSTYTVRVELHSSQYNPDFEILYREMNKEGFSKLIMAVGGKIYHLPRGEYNISTSKNRIQVLEATKRALQATGELGEILVTESSGRSWYGLSEKK